MDRLQLIAYIKTLIDEVSPSNNLTVQLPSFSDNKPVDDLIDALLDFSARFVLRSAPLSLLPAQSIDLSQVQIQTLPPTSSPLLSSVKPATYGLAPLPSSFIRLLSAQMDSWLQPVTQAVTLTSPQAVLLGNPYARSGNCRPWVGLTSSALWIVPCTAANLAAASSYFHYVPFTLPQNLSADLQQAVAWHCAAQVLATTGSVAQSEVARNQFSQTLALFNV